MEKARIYTLFSSSKGNCCYIKYREDEILIDCGASARAIESALSRLGTGLDRITAIFITHEHTDHIGGLATVAKRYGIPIYAPEASCACISCRIPPERSIIPLTAGKAVELKSLALCPIPTPHDAHGSVGFRIRAGEEKIGYFTDIGHLSENILRGLSGCERVVIESNHDIDMLKNGSYPYSLKQRILGERGHLSNELCARLLPHLANHGTRSFMLAHLSEENNTAEAAYNESLASLNASGYEVNTESEQSLRLAVASPCNICELI